MNDTVMTRPRVFIEESFPIDLLNEQVLKETGSTPFNAVHRWFSRKPLSFSRASVLASLLPSDTTPDEFKRLLGVPTRLGGKDYRLYQITPSPELIADVQSRLKHVWGDDVNLLDAFAGGGSIPFEAVRYGISTVASDLNPVAVATMKAAIEVPFLLGPSFISDLNYWVDWVGKELERDLMSFFPSCSEERTRDYLWVHTARCPECALHVPLAPSWWVDKSAPSCKASRASAVRLIVPANRTEHTCSFEILRGPVKNGLIAGYDPVEAGTLSRASGRCPRCKAVLPQQYLWAQGQSGQMSFQMYAVVFHNAQGVLSFKAPSHLDLDAAVAAERAIKANEDNLLQQDLIPTEMLSEVPIIGSRISSFGLYVGRDLYAPRQLLSLTTIVSTIRCAVQLYSETASRERTQALALWLSMVLDRCVDMNSRLSNWNPHDCLPHRATTTHSLNLMWNFPESSGATRLWQSCSSVVAGNYSKLCQMVRQPVGIHEKDGLVPTSHLCITVSDAADLQAIDDKSIVAVVTDPPYYASIPYSELANMFYMWQKRVLGTVFPDMYASDLTDYELETVASQGRFRGFPNPAELANRDYETKLARAFSEYHRVLRDDGVLTVQFNHKESGAWDILSQTLINAGFEITATWAVNTENPNSLHQAEKNAVNSTVILVCRKRDSVATAWWEEVQPQVRQAVMDRVPKLEAMGMKGIDLYLAAFGPALQVLSRHWPVRDRSNRDIRPDVALQEARHAVVDERMMQMSEGRFVQLDPVSRFYLVAWDCFLAREFSFDEARLLALSTGDVDITALRCRF